MVGVHGNGLTVSIWLIYDLSSRVSFCHEPSNTPGPTLCPDSLICAESGLWAVDFGLHRVFDFDSIPVAILFHLFLVPMAYPKTNLTIDHLRIASALDAPLGKIDSY
jgi:hypothetical protein